jgi:hypothetical protein
VVASTFHVSDGRLLCAINKHLEELCGFERFYTTLIFASLNDCFGHSIERYHSCDHQIKENETEVGKTCSTNA